MLYQNYFDFEQDLTTLELRLRGFESAADVASTAATGAAAVDEDLRKLLHATAV